MIQKPLFYNLSDVGGYMLLLELVVLFSSDRLEPVLNYGADKRPLQPVYGMSYYNSHASEYCFASERDQGWP
jgi:hypothetical protein